MSSHSQPWWRLNSLSNLRRFELLTYSSLYPAFALPPLVIILWTLQGGVAPNYLAAGNLLAIISMALATLAGLWVMIEYFQKQGLTRAKIAALAITFPLAIALVMAAPMVPKALMWPSGLLIAAQGLALISLWHPGRISLLVILGLTALVCLLRVQAGDSATEIWGMVLMNVLFGGALAYAVRMSWWMIAVLRELDQARIIQAELAVAEERLRFSQDLHDIFGRTLSVVSVKSQLAAALASRGDERAHAQMLEVRKIAAEALVEVREVVQGYREVSAAVELSGAAGLLRSAGIEPRFDPETLAPLPESLSEPVAWFIREAVTNVVRHSQATWCELTLSTEPGQITCTITNDGAPDPVPVSTGTGIVGLAERLARHGGRVQSHARGGNFEISVTLPA